MKLIKVENLENNIVSLEVQVEKEEFDAACNQAYLRDRKNIILPGFRKGKAPRKMIEKMYGEGVFYEDAVNIVYPKAYQDAVEEADIEPIDQADVEVTALSPDGFSFVAKVQTPPDAVVKEYKGLSAPKEEAKVEEADVDAEIDRLRRRNSSIASVERAAKMGDTVNLDFEGFVDEKAFEGGKGERYDLVLGSGSFIPGFEDQLVGVSAGEDKTVEVTFPEEYHAEDLKGKKAVFRCKINEVKETLLPDLDDEFAKDVSEDCETMEQLREKIRKNLLETRQKTLDSQYEEALLDRLVENTEVEVPEVMISTQLDRIMEDMSMRMQMQGLSLEAYLQLVGTTIDEMRKQYHDQAARQVKIGLALHQVAKEENIVITDETVAEEYDNLAKRYNMPLERVKQAVGPHGIRRDLLTERALAVVKENAKAEKPVKKAAKKTTKKAPAAKKETAEDGEKKPAKKTTTRKTTKKTETAKETTKTEE